MSIAREPAVTDHSVTQRLFGLGVPTRGVNDCGKPVNRMSMDIGAIAAHTADTSYSGVLGVLLDDLLGFTLWDRRGTRAGIVTAELSIDIFTPRRWQGPALWAEGRLLALTADGGTSTAHVYDSTGTLIGTGTLWGNFVDDPGHDSGAASPNAPQLPDFPELGVPPLEWIGGQIENGPEVRVVIPPNPLVSNKRGYMHGGVQACAMSLAANAALSGAGPDMDTASVRINYFRPVSLDSDVTFTAAVIKSGRAVSVIRVTGTSGGQICTEATVTGRRLI
ncbi:PaaI family thioesterase [Rhodococcus marinonascens]|uniref:PaaI family thioesterase n=1 Tax=Rhodococcus marinonascens TaxID=38311 RepID=UPI0009326D66|nr:PaaI family thioesterase [Rhodococcus marinonascens]